MTFLLSDRPTVHTSRDWPVRATGVAITLLPGSFGLLAAAIGGLARLILGALLMDACSQAIHVTNQAVIHDLTSAARQAANTRQCSGRSLDANGERTVANKLD